jgi:hypothetical protein
MTAQAFSSLFTPAPQADTPAFWWGLLDAIVEERQCKSNDLVANYLRRHEDEHGVLAPRPLSR